MARVSVIIPAYNYAHFLPEAIESVLQQNYRDFEIIVVDDGSTDNTREVLYKYWNKITYIYQENKGLPAARNTGIRASQSDYIAFLDADDLWMPEKLELQVGLMDKRQDVSLVYSNVFILDETGGKRKVTYSWSQDVSKNPLKELLLSCPIPVLTVLIRRQAIEKCGLFDETLTYSEDWDMWLRLALDRSNRFVIINKHLAQYRIHGTGTYSLYNPSSLERDKKNSIIILNKIFGSSLLPFDLIQYKKQAYSNIYSKIGYRYLRINKAWEGRKNLIWAITLYPRALTPYLFFVLFFGQRRADKVSNLKRKLVRKVEVNKKVSVI